MGKTRPLPLTMWPAVELRGAGGGLATRPDATLRLAAPDLLPADDFEARLAEIDGARFEGGVVRGGRVVTAPRPPPSPRKPSSAPPPAPPRRAREPARNKLPSYPALKLEIPAMYYDDTNDDELVSRFRTGPFARLRALIARLF